MEMVSRQRNTSGADSITQGGLSVSYNSNTGGKSDLVLDAETLLQKYKLICY